MNELEWRGAVARTVDKLAGDRFNWSVVPERVMRQGFEDRRPVEAFAQELVTTFGDLPEPPSMPHGPESKAGG